MWGARQITTYHLGTPKQWPMVLDNCGDRHDGETEAQAVTMRPASTWLLVSPHELEAQEDLPLP